jgi:hypothetical protein
MPVALLLAVTLVMVTGKSAGRILAHSLKQDSIKSTFKHKSLSQKIPIKF